jgi:MoaA/NifB/PqqE/SkfB family radical SAM enzyme
MRNFIDDYLIIKGICDGRKAFKGPLSAQIDLTDNCDNNCICCWCNSPLLKNPVKQNAKHFLERSVAIRTIDELKEMGAREITISGGGEPLLYPYLLDIISHIKKKKIYCQLYTSFMPVTPYLLKELVGLNLDRMVVSLWAANAKTYHLLHPNKEESCFNEIKEKLIYLSRIKKNKKFPLVRINNVINALNYNELNQMADLASQVGSDELCFTVMDNVAGSTDALLLNNAQRQVVIKDVKKLSRKVVIYGIEDFIRRISCEGSVSGGYDIEAAEETPCYSGWLFVRIKADGKVNPCLKSHRLPVGDVNKMSFREIWNSPLQQAFRENTKTLGKNNPYFYQIGNGTPDQSGCLRICDDLSRNVIMHRKITLFPTGRLIIMIIGLQNKMQGFNKRIANFSRISYLVFVVLTYTLLLKICRSVKKISIFPGE